MKEGLRDDGLPVGKAPAWREAILVMPGLAGAARAIILEAEGDGR